MQADKKQAPQLAVLGILVVFCVGYVSFKVIAPKAAAPKAPPAAASAAAAVQPNGDAVSGQPVATVTPQAELPAGSPDLAAVPVRRDPFTPQKLPFDENDPAVAVRAPVARPMAVPVVKNPMGSVPPLALKPITPFSQGGGQVAAAPAAEDIEPQFTLTGVVRGEKNVAIIRSSDKGRHVIKQGQLIDGRYRVLSVTGDGAVLAYKNRRIYVKLGGAKNAS